MLRILATILHPIFIPLIVVFGYLYFNILPEDLKWLMYPTWVLFVGLILPGAYLKLVRKEIDIQQPSLDHRETIYKLLMLTSGVLAVAFWLMDGKLGLFFLCQWLMLFLLYLVAKYTLKASWHSAGWVQLFFASLIVYWHYPFNELIALMAVSAGLAVLVYFVRLKAHAHTHFELLIGISIGVVSCIPLLFI